MTTTRSKRLEGLALAALLGLLLVLALRMTMGETLRENLAQKAAILAARSSGEAADLPPFVGPVVTVGLAVATGFLAAIAACCAAAARSLTLGRFARFLLVGAIAGLAIGSAFAAASRFSAIVGAADLAMALLAGWTISLLCQQAMLGDRGRRIVIAATVALLAAWVCKGLDQRFAEFPDTIADYQRHREQHLRDFGINPKDAYQVQLFESRMNAMEVSGFLSLSNVMAAGLIGLTAGLAGLLAATLPVLRRTPPAAPGALGGGQATRARRTGERSPPAPSSPQGEVSLDVVIWTLGAILLVLGLLVAILTGSRGGSILSFACAAVIAIGAWQWRKVVAWRKRILLAAALVAILGAAALLGYGLLRHTLPSKSLMFRWQYWTASVRIIEQAPLHGVGLNNFGDYYPAYKLASSPEDVSDPHSFFVRLAAEIGIPAAVLMAALILWQVLGAARMPAGKPQPAPARVPVGELLAAAVLCAAWWIIEYSLADAANLYYVYLTVIFTAISAAAAWGALRLSALLPSAGLRGIAAGLLVGALGMLAYDQINYALVTGPVAMLFWITLGAADSYGTPAPGPASSTGRWRSAIGAATALASAAGTIVLASLVWIPLLRGDMPWNPAPSEWRFLEAMRPPINPRSQLTALDQAIARAPRSVELRTQRILVKQGLHLPIGGDIHEILKLDRTSARLRIMLASLNSGLTPQERAAILQEALNLDKQLPPKEPKHLTEAEKEHVQRMIAELQREKSSSR